MWRPTVAACCASPTLTGNRGDAEDLLQDTLADAYRNWSKVAASHAPYAYVRRILVNRHTSRMRKRSASERPVDPTAIPAAAEPDHVTAVAPFAGSGGGKGSRREPEGGQQSPRRDNQLPGCGVILIGAPPGGRRDRRRLTPRKPQCRPLARPRLPPRRNPRRSAAGCGARCGPCSPSACSAPSAWSSPTS
ncbi:hypothetical protein BN11_3000005 [Nostocoides australiense Ben110]|uniref:RNA polymerase sigma-70 region 2 domain-containing protein n=1 Tax=Nostocoides australiense Ben110 TaxID=1193182 RepID=W6K3P2_9MICO|nr:hypothetical protein BN11_3000005 [Tetrasphaera australiensis Ben110]